MNPECARCVADNARAARPAMKNGPIAVKQSKLCRKVTGPLADWATLNVLPTKAFRGLRRANPNSQVRTEYRSVLTSEYETAYLFQVLSEEIDHPPVLNICARSHPQLTL